MGCGASNNSAIDINTYKHPLVSDSCLLRYKMKLYEAIEKNDQLCVRHGLAWVPVTENLNPRTSDHYISFHAAAELNSDKAMETLIGSAKKTRPDIQAIIEIPNAKGQIPAVICILKDASETFGVLLRENLVRADYRDNQGHSIADLCIQHSPKCLDLLEGKNVVSSTSSSNASRATVYNHPLVTNHHLSKYKLKMYKAIQKNSLIHVRHALGYGVTVTENLNPINADHYISFHAAAEFNADKAMELLISSAKQNQSDLQAIIEIPDAQGHIPVVICILKDASEAFGVLLKENLVKTNYRDNQGQTIADLCRKYSPKCLKLLEEYGHLASF